MTSFVSSTRKLLLAAAAFLTTASLPAESPNAGPLAAAESTSLAKFTARQRVALSSVVRDSTGQIWFQENAGQFAEGVRYGFRTKFGSMLVYGDHLRIVANQMDAATGAVGLQAVDLAFPGGTGDWEIVPGGASSVAGAYQQSDGTTLTPRIFNELTLRDVYRGVDLRLYSADKGVLEFDWIVAKAQDYAQIRLSAHGQDGMDFNADGSATLKLRFQDLTLQMPATYQVIGGEKHALGGAMIAAETPGTMRYAVTGNLVADQPLIIDPNVVWSTFIDLNDLATDTTDSTPSQPFDSYIFAVNANANGTYASGWIREIVTNGSYANYMEVNAGFAQGTVLNQTYLYRLSNDGLHITAWTSTGVTSPLGGVSNQKLNGLPSDLELFPDGRVLLGFSQGLLQIYSADLSTQSYSGTPVTMDTLNSLAVLNNNSFYVGGRVAAAIPAAQIPAANIGPDSTFGGALEGVIIRYSNAATTPVPDWATYVGGDADEYFTAIALTPDLTKLVFAVSTSGGTPASFGTLANAVDTTISGTELVVGVLAEGATKPAAFDVLSFLGGSGNEGTLATNTTAAVVTATNTYFYVGGTTASTDLPGTTGGAQPTNGGGTFDAFASRIPLNGSAGTGFQTTYMGGAGQDRIGGIAYDTRADRLLIFGTTTGSFPTLNTTPASNYYQGTFGGSTYDIFVATVNGALTAKDYATYIGGTQNDYLGQTGALIGQGHVVYSEATGLTYLATTVHSADLPAGAIGTPPGKDRVKSNGTNDTHFVIAFNINVFDYGDAPATFEGGSPAKEALSSTLRIGATVDAEAGPASGPGANGDDQLTSDDEDGIATLPVLLTTQSSYSVNVSVFNNTGSAQTLNGWIDLNLDGTFEANEIASVSVPSSASQQTVTLTWASLPALTAGQSYLRLRLSTVTLTDNAATPNIDERSIGAGGFGEIEDYALSIVPETLSVSNVATTEGTDPYAVFTVSLSQPAPSPITVSLALANGTAGAADYGPGLQVSTNGGTTWTTVTTATFATGATSVLVRTPIIDDTLQENTEDFTLTATTTAGSTTNPSATGTATIADNDGPPALTINDVTRNEKAGTAVFTVSLSTASGLPITVNYATASGTATSGADFTATSGTLSFPAGTTTQTITVPILDDTIYEGSETYNVVLSSPANATISKGTGIGTILDDGTGGGGTDNDKPALSVNNVTVTEGTDPYAIFTVALSNASAFTTTVSLTLADGTAVSPADYGPGVQVSINGGTTWTAATSASFAPGATSVLVRTPIVDDSINENTETFTLTAATTAGTTINASATGTGTILDNDAQPSLSINDVTRNEKAGTAVFTVTLSAASGLPITVGYATASGTATSGADFTATSGTLNFPAGTTARTITVPIIDDSIYEGSETYNVVLSSPSNATINKGTGIGTILDDGTGAGGTDNDKPTLSVNNVTVTEGTDPYAVFTVALSNASAFTTTVSLTLADGTAVSPADYGPGVQVSTNGGTTWTAATSASFAPGATSVLVRTPIVDDSINENTETFTLTAATTAGTTLNASATGTGTILDNDAQPSLSINDVTRNEKAGTAVFTVTLSAASGLPITVAYATASGTATSGADFTATSGTLNFAAGTTTQTITVPIIDDNVYEGSETYNVVLSSPTNATINKGTGVGTILDDGTGGGGADNDKPVLSVSNVTVTEGTDPFAVFTVALSNPSAFATTVSLTLTDGTAKVSSDYGPGLQVSTNGGTTWTSATAATFSPGATSVLARTAIIDDTIPESTETFTLTAAVTSGTTFNASATGTGTILDNDAAPTLSIDDVTRNEKAGTATFTVTLSGASSLPITVAYATASGTATSGADFTATSGTLTFPAGTTTQTITVPIIDDNIYEGSENYTVVLSSPTNATINKGTGVGTILDDGTGGGGTDNDKPVLSVSNVTGTEGTDPFAVFAVALSNPSAFATTVSLTLTDGTAKVSSDYGPGLQVSTNGGTSWTSATAATFAPGVTSVLARTAIIDDTIPENTETFTLTAATTAGTTFNASATGTGTILDDDPAPSLSINNVTRNEKAGTAVFTVTLSGASGLPITVGYATASGTATSGADFTATSGTLNFAPGTTTQTITVPIIDDNIYEGSENYTVVLSSPTNATINKGTGIGMILDDGTGGGGTDNDKPALSVNNVTVTEGTDPYAVFTVALTNPSALATTVSLTLTDGTAKVSSDYGPGLQVSTNGGTSWTSATAATFAPGVTSVLARTAIIDDTIPENTETFTLTATTTAGTTLNPAATGTVTILDNDPAPSLSIDNVTRNEKAGTAVFTVTLSGPSALPITVAYATASGTATSGADFTATSGTLTFPAGTTTQTITVPILDDNIYEGSESYTVVLSSPTNATIGTGTGIGTILDDGTGGGGTDNDKPALSVGNVTVTEGTDAYAVFPIALSNSSAFATTVSLTLADGSATASSDYGPGLQVSTNGGATWAAASTATFPPGVTSLLVRTPIIDDNIAENTETFTLTAAVTAGTTLNPSATGTGTILDNDAATLSINDVSVSEEAGPAVFTVTLSIPSALPVTVAYASAGGTATSGVDFTPVSGTLTFPAGTTSQTISVPIIDDSIYEGNETFTVTLSTPANATIARATGTGTIVDNPVTDNRPPVANPDNATTLEDTPIDIAVLTNDTDPDHDPLTVTAATVPAAQGTVSINANGTLHYTPALNFNGIATLNYSIADGNGGSSSTTVTVTVTPVNDAPIATNDAATTPENRPIVITVLANDSDPENDPLTVTKATVTGGRGTVVINPDSTIEFTPAPGFTGPATVVYTISDGQGGTATALVSILVNGLPIATDDFASTTPGTAKLIPVLLNDLDPEGLPLTIVDATILANQGTLAIAPGGQLLYTPATGVVGTVAGHYTIRDPAGNIASASVTITIAQTPAPSPPVAVSDSAATVRQTPVTIPVLQNDSDPAGGALNVIAASVPAAQGTVVQNQDGTLTFTAAAGFVGSATITYTIQNPAGATASAPAIVQVSDGNAPPLAQPDFATAATGVPKIVYVLRNDTDPENDPLSVVSASVPPAQGTVQVNADGTVTFTSAPAFTGTAVIAYTITDGRGGNSSSTATITVSAAPVNNPPVANNDTAGTPVDHPVDVPVLANDRDPDGDPLTVTSVTVPAGQGSATINPDGSIHFVPAAGLNSDVVLTYTISDGRGGTASALITINVNDKPLAVSDRANTLPGVPVTVAVLANDSDPNDNPLTVTDATSDPAQGTLVINSDGTLRFTPVAGFTGVAEVPYTITDGKGGYAEAIAFITVNSPPVPINDSAFTPLGQPVTVAVLTNDTDPDTDPLTVVGATVDPVQGTVVINADGTLTFTPATTFTGPAVITYTVTDPKGARRSATATITRGNIAPVANDRKVYTYCATPLEINALRTATDADGNPLTVIAVTQPQHGQVTIRPNGYVLYRPNLNYTTTTTDSFTVTISDGHGGTTTETIRVRSFAAIAGTFQGLLEDAAVPLVAAAPDIRGRLTITLNNRAAFSARLELDGTVTPFTGTLVGALTYHRTLRIGGQPVTVTVTYDDLADRWSAGATGGAFSVRQDASGLERRRPARHLAARYSERLVPRNGATPPGAALIRVGGTGAVTIIGYLPSGSAFSTGAFLNAADTAAIYRWIPANLQSLAGPVQTPAVPTDTPTGALQWDGNVSGAPDILDLEPAGLP